jgi:peptidyl-dipeptidase A
MLLLLAGCVSGTDSEFPATADGAEQFVEDANTRLKALAELDGRADWIAKNFITFDSEALAALHTGDYVSAQTEYGVRSARWNDVDVDPTTRRQLDLMRTSISKPAPSDPALATELSEIAAGMSSNYGKAQYCREGGAEDDCLEIGDITAIHTESRDAQQLLDAWIGWRTTSPEIRDDYERFVQRHG